MSDRNNIFLERREDEYEKQMMTHWDSFKSNIQLTLCHAKIKSAVLDNIRDTWNREMGRAKFPEDLTKQLYHQLDLKLDLLKIHLRSKLDAADQESLSTGIKSLLTTNIQNPVSTSSNSHKARHEFDNEYTLGIDLGTTMCCVAVKTKNKIEIVENRAQGNKKTTPSYIQFSEKGEGSYGYTAKDTAFRNTENTVFDAKRMIGRPWHDPQLQNDRKLWPFEVVDGNGNPKIKTGNRTRFPHEVSARLLLCLRRMAEEFLHCKRESIKKAVITVPAYFSEPQRRATKDAAELAGIEVLNILSEPTAAALAYKLEKKIDGTRKALIYDLGGGTFDVSIAEVQDEKVDIICVHGDTHLGGQDFDHVLMNYCMDKFQKETGIDLLKGRESEDKRDRDSSIKAIGRLKASCELAKERLSSTDVTTIDIDNLYRDKDFSLELTRDTFNNLCKPMVQKTLDILEKALEDAKSKGIVDKKSIDDIILVGGSTRVPLVAEMVQTFFEGKILCKHINPDEAVAIGAAIQADTLKKLGAVCHRDAQEKGGIQDVTPLNIGIECEGDEFSVIIPRNQKIPCSFDEEYCTSDDYQTELQFTICQGDSEKATRNLKLGEFIFKGIPKDLAEKEKIKVTMAIDSNGILQIKAVSMSTNKNVSITISSNQLGMREEEIKEIKEELAKLNK